MTHLPLPVSTERLVIRAFRASDRRFEEALAANPSLFVHLPVGPRSATEIDQYVQARLAQTSLDEVGATCALIVEAVDTGEYVGSMQLTPTAIDPLQLQIGWIALPHQHGNGFMTEAVGQVVDFVFRTTDAHRVVAEIFGGNDASIRLAERVGFRKEAHFARSVFVKGDWWDELVYAILADERAERGPSDAARS